MAKRSKKRRRKTLQSLPVEPRPVVGGLPKSSASLRRLLNLLETDRWTMKILFVMFGGSLGALCRYGVSLLAASLLGSRFPWGTLIVNLAGCFLIGLSFALAERSSFMNPSVRLFFVTGYLGALTTFSTFALETVNSIRGGTLLVTGMNILSNNVVGCALVFLGMWVGRLR
jgi:fluoride exporter